MSDPRSVPAVKRAVHRVMRLIGRKPAGSAGGGRSDPDTLARAMFLADHYRRVAGLPDDLPDDDAFRHFMVEGSARGLEPSPLFDAPFYLEAASAAGLPACGPGENAFRHWLSHGVERRIVPTPVFDEAFYLEIHKDVSAAGRWGFEHFVKYGAAEGRIPSAGASFVGPVWRSRRPDLPPFYRALLSQMDAGASAEDHAARRARERELLASPALAEVLRQASDLEPEIGDRLDTFSIRRPPSDDLLYHAHVDLEGRLAARRYDILVVIPFCRMGGADLTAGLLTQALRRLRPDDRILVLRTDSEHFERPDWFPAGVETVDLSDMTRAIGPDGSERLLYTLLTGLRPHSVFNVNSRLLWGACRRYGRQLAARMDLYAYLFCWDRTPSGQRVGFASAFFSEALPNLAGVFTDSDFMREDLTGVYALPPAYRDRIVTLATPLRLVSQTSWDPNAPRDANGPLILWAGRFDRQKRFDLVVRIAAAMPDVRFACWGKPVLDDPADTGVLPPNLAMQGPFGSPTELPLQAAAGWLYTSAWDGRPNMLVEVGALGIPVVASGVGGVREIVGPDCGWVVEDPDDADAYVAALRKLLADPGEAARRAARLRSRVLERHRPEAYDAALAEVLARNARA